MTDRIVNQLLTIMDGADGLEGVYVLGATSRPDLVDTALLRPGRLDKLLYCGLPTKDDRREIIQSVLSKAVAACDIDIDYIAEHTNDWTGADLQALIGNAHLEAVHEKLEAVTITISDSLHSSPNYTITGKTISEELKLELSEQAERIADTTMKTKVWNYQREHSSVCLNMHHISIALQKTAPSLSTKEKFRFDKIYDKFDHKREGQKATLA